MLPFPIYSIPETSYERIPSQGQWLCVVVGEALTAPNQDLMEKICLALKADLANDVFIQEIDPNHPISFHTHNRFKLIISFGIKPAQLGIWIDLHTPGIKYLESYTFILTTTLTDLAQSPAAKKQLWNAMLTYLDMNTTK